MDLSFLDLGYAELTSADLTGANLTGATLDNARLVGATLTNAVFTDASLVGANLDQAMLPAQLPMLPVIDGATVTVLTNLNVSNSIVVDPGGLLTVNAPTASGSLAGEGIAMVVLGTGSLTVGSDNTSTAFSGSVGGGRPLIKTGTGTLTFDGFLDNTDLNVVVNDGALVLGKWSLQHPVVNAVGASLTLGGGTVRLAGTGGNQINDSASVTIDGGMLDLNGRKETIGQLTGTGGMITNLAASTTATLTVASAGDSTYAGVIQDGSGTVSLAKTGAGKLTLSGGSTFAGAITIAEGTLALMPSATLAGSNPVTNNAGLEIDAAAAALGSISGTGVTVVGDGAHPASLTTPQLRQQQLTIRDGAAVALVPGTAGSPTISIVSGLTIEGTGMLDLGYNDLVLNYSGTSPLDDWAQAIAAGSIFTSVDHPTPSTNAAVALVDNACLHLATWHGVAISDGSNFNQLLFATTYPGDGNIDGVVDASDYLNVIANMGRTPATWLDGDFDGDGAVTAADFAIVDQNIGSGTGGGFGPPLAMTAVRGTAVPEPGTMALCLLTGLLFRRRG